MKKHSKKITAFTLVELLAVISVIAILLAVLMPALGAARQQGKAIVCGSNIRQLVLANIGYATENDGYYVPAASDMYLSNGGYHRWHGVRENENDMFDPLKGPLVGYLGDGAVKECPEKVKFVKGQDWDDNFEQGCGGYGYNAAYIGSRLWQGRINENYQKTSRITEVARPAETVIFADCAMVKKRDGTIYYLEYSFAEPPLGSEGYTSPSIHFRHRKKANIAWVDGHISSTERINFNRKNDYGVKSADFEIGWFGPLNNSLFDLK